MKIKLLSHALAAGALLLAGGAYANGNMSSNEAAQMDQGHQAQQEAQLDQNQNEVKRVQRELKDEGYAVGPIDGVLGTKTISALKRFQKDNDLSATGKIDQQTLASLSGQENVGTSSGASEGTNSNEKLGDQGSQSTGTSSGAVNGSGINDQSSGTSSGANGDQGNQSNGNNSSGSQRNSQGSDTTSRY